MRFSYLLCSLLVCGSFDSFSGCFAMEDKEINDKKRSRDVFTSSEEKKFGNQESLTVLKKRKINETSENEAEEGLILKQLPDEVLLCIFDHLTFKDLLALSQVSSQCYRLSNDSVLWTSQARAYQLIREDESVSKLGFAIRKYGSLPSKQFQYLAAKFPHEPFATLKVFFGCYDESFIEKHSRQKSIMNQVSLKYGGREVILKQRYTKLFEKNFRSLSLKFKSSQGNQEEKEFILSDNPFMGLGKAYPLTPSASNSFSKLHIAYDDLPLQGKFTVLPSNKGARVIKIFPAAVQKNDISRSAPAYVFEPNKINELEKLSVEDFFGPSLFPDQLHLVLSAERNHQSGQIQVNKPKLVLIKE